MEWSTTIAGNCDLPGDLVIDILLRLPVKTLMRFRRVSKSWNGLVKDPTFVSNHLASSRRTNDELLLFYSRYHRAGINFVNPNTTTSVDMRLPDFIQFTESTDAEVPHPSIVGSCNGLLCISTCRANLKLFLCNPATKDFMALPKPRITQHDSDRTLVTGFGFNPNTNDYEVVRSLCYKEKEDSYQKLGRVDVEVYSRNLGAWSKYRALQASFVRDCWNDPNPMASRGVIHWMGYKRPEEDCPTLKVIAGFDLKTRRFTDMMLPDDPSNSPASCPKLTVVGGELGLFLSRGSFIDFWVMKTYGVHESWTKQLSIPLGVDLIGFAKWSTRKGEVIMTRQKRKQGVKGMQVEFSAYDPLVKKLKPINVRGSGGSYNVEGYMESLISVT